MTRSLARVRAALFMAALFMIAVQWEKRIVIGISLSLQGLESCKRGVKLRQPYGEVVGRLSSGCGRDLLESEVGGGCKHRQFFVFEGVGVACFAVWRV